MQSPFSIEESLKFGWTTLKHHSGLVFKVVLTLLALEVASAIVNKVLVGSALGFVAAVVLYVAIYVCEIGLLNISLKLAKGGHAIYADIIPPVQLIIKYFAASVLVALIIAVPAALAVGVGVGAVTFLPFGGAVAFVFAVIVAIGILYLMMRYFLVGFSVLDGESVTGALRKSARVTHDIKWHLLGFFIVILLLNIVGAILFFIGLLVTIPVTMLAVAHVYTKLAGR